MSNNRKTTGSSGGDFQIAPAGTHLAICFGLAYIGNIKDTYHSSEGKYVDKVMFGFELCNEKAVFDENKGEEPFGLWTWPYTNSIGTKAKLNHFILSWRNKSSFSETEMKEGFDLSTVVGKACMLGISHTEGENVYANIKSIMPPIANMGILQPYNKPFVFDVANPSEEMRQLFFRLPKWIRDKVRESKEYLQQNLNWLEKDEQQSQAPQQQQPQQQQSGGNNQNGW